MLCKVWKGWFGWDWMIKFKKYVRVEEINRV